MDPRDPRPSAPAAATVATSTRLAAVGGDTARLPSIDPATGSPRSSAAFGRSAAANPRGPSAPRPGTARPAPLPRRSVQAPARFGFFGFLVGLIGLIIRMTIVTLLVGGLAAGLAYVAVQNFVKTDTVVVPDVKGRKIEQAFEALSDKGFAIKRERTELSGIVAPGEVIEQRPASGTSAKSGTTIQLVVSSGRAAYVVPDVRSETRENAINKVKGARLLVGDVTFHEDEKTPKDTVISQSPEPNKGLDVPTKVDLLISSGPRGSSMSMPDVTARPVAEARASLERLGITDITLDPADAPPTAQVVGQDPLVGKTILQSERVVLKAVVPAKASVTGSR